MKINFLSLPKSATSKDKPKISLLSLFLVAIFFFIGGFFLDRYLTPPITPPPKEDLKLALEVLPEVLPEIELEFEFDPEIEPELEPKIELDPEIEPELEPKIELEPEIELIWDDLAIIQLREELIMKIAEEASLATVAIEAKTLRGPTSFGSGFIISPDGLIVTNRHVALPTEPILEYRITIHDGTLFLAQMVDYDPFQDFAVLQIKSLENQPLPIFSYLNLGDSDLLRLGQTVIFIGNLLGELPHSVNVGTIAYLNRDIFAMDNLDQIRIDNAIQITATVNLGNSGGPLLNLNGELVGMITAKGAIGEGIGFALPVNDFKESIQEIKNYGEIIHSFLGITYTNLGLVFIEEYQMPGFLIIRVVPNSPAFNFINEGDIIVKINNQIIEVNTSLGEVIRQHDPGDKIDITVIRDEQRIVIKDIILEKRRD